MESDWGGGARSEEPDAREEAEVGRGDGASSENDRIDVSAKVSASPAGSSAISRDPRHTHEKLVPPSAVVRFRSRLKCTAVMSALPSGVPYRLRMRTRRRTW